MSDRPDNEVEPLNPILREYVDAYAALERPSEQTSAAMWAAIEDSTTPPPRRFILAGIMVAVAAALLLFLVKYDRMTFDRMMGGSSAQAIHTQQPTPASAVPSVRTPPRALPSNCPPSLTPLPPTVPPPTAQAITPTPSTPPAPTPPPRTQQENSRKPSRLPTLPEPTLSEQLQRFKVAQAMLNNGQAREALHRLNRYVKAFPTGAFVLEAQVLQVEALCATGQIARANSRRRRFLRVHSNSPLVSRMHGECSARETHE